MCQHRQISKTSLTERGEVQKVKVSIFYLNIQWQVALKMGPSDFWLLTISSSQGEPPTVGFTDLLNEEKAAGCTLGNQVTKDWASILGALWISCPREPCSHVIRQRCAVRKPWWKGTCQQPCERACMSVFCLGLAFQGAQLEANKLDCHLMRHSG